MYICTLSSLTFRTSWCSHIYFSHLVVYLKKKKIKKKHLDSLISLRCDWKFMKLVTYFNVCCLTTIWYINCNWIKYKWIGFLLKINAAFFSFHRWIFFSSSNYAKKKPRVFCLLHSNKNLLTTMWRRRKNEIPIFYFYVSAENSIWKWKNENSECSTRFYCLSVFCT